MAFSPLTFESTEEGRYPLAHTNLSIEGTWGYRTYPSTEQICVYGDKIANYRNGGKSGTLKLAVYASKKPYSGGYINGYCLFEKSLGQLSGGYNFTNLNKIGNLNCPPSGEYCMVLLLLEYSAYNGYEIVDYMNFNNTAKW